MRIDAHDGAETGTEANISARRVSGYVLDMVRHSKQLTRMSFQVFWKNRTCDSIQVIAREPLGSNMMQCAETIAEVEYH